MHFLFCPGNLQKPLDHHALLKIFLTHEQTVRLHQLKKTVHHLAYTLEVPGPVLAFEHRFKKSQVIILAWNPSG